MGKLIDALMGGDSKPKGKSDSPKGKVECSECGDMISKKNAIYKGKKVLCEDCEEALESPEYEKAEEEGAAEERKGMK